MTAEPLPALRALSVRALGDLARGLRSGHLAISASSFMIRYTVPGVSEAAAAELSLLLSTGLTPKHAALLLDVSRAPPTW